MAHYMKELADKLDNDAELREAWKANKKSTGNGCYKYVCGHISLKTGKKCMRELKDSCDKCHYHRKK